VITLWPHQLAAAERIRRNEISALWWEMRTGKTLAAIAGTDDGDRLIVCPNSVKGVWAADLDRYDQPSYIWGTNPFPKERPKNVIVNYESVWRTKLLAWGWDSVIFDESLRLQNMRTQLWNVTQKTMQSLRKGKRVLLLSGTPCPEGYHQIITQSITASGNYCGESDPWAALRKYYLYDEKSYKWKIQPGHKKAAKAQLMALGPSMSQAEAGVNTKKLYRSIWVPLGDHERQLWAVTDKSVGPATLCMYAQSVASGRSIEGKTEYSHKLDAVADYARELTEQCVIFTHFTESLEYLYRHLSGASRIWGGDPGAEYRTDILRRFSAGEIRTIVANIATIKVGLNLSAAGTVIFAENSFSGEARIQAEERATVMGKDSVEVVDFLSKGAEMPGQVDEYILAAVRAKKDFNHHMLRTK
jgi:SNF2 family DNA or RNA helicase